MRFEISVVDGVQTMASAPVFRASEGCAAAFRLVSGQECFGPAVAVQQVESVSGAGLAGAVRVLGLVALGEALAERHGYVGRGLERPRSISQPVLARLSGSADDSSKGDNGTKPMTSWDFRTSSPPG